MRAFHFVAMILWFQAAGFAAVAADWSTIKIGTEGRFPPWNATNSDGDLVGFEIDLAENLCQRLATKCEIIPQIWNGMIPALNTGRYDAIMAGMTITKERERTIRFTSCYANEPAAFASVSDSPLATTSTDIAKVDLATLESEEQAAIHTLRKSFAGAVIGAQIASAHGDFVQQFFDDIAEIQPFDTLENLILGLDAGQVDLIFLSKSVLRRLADSEGASILTPIGPDIAGGILGKGVGVGVRVEDDDLRQMFDAAIAAAIEDGSITALSERWFGYDLSC